MHPTPIYPYGTGRKVYKRENLSLKIDQFRIYVVDRIKIIQHKNEDQILRTVQK